MMRVTTLYAGTAAITAAYYTAYLTRAEGELPGKWMGQQAHAFGLSGDVTTEHLEALLSGRDPIDGTPLGQPLVDRVKTTARSFAPSPVLTRPCLHLNPSRHGGRSPATIDSRNAMT